MRPSYCHFNGNTNDKLWDLGGSCWQSRWWWLSHQPEKISTTWRSSSLEIHWPETGFKGITLIWLVVYLPLWKIWVRQLGWLFPIYGKIKLFQTTRDNMDMNHLRKMWPESKVLDQVQSFRAQPGIRPSVHQCCDLLRWKITSSNGTSYASWWNSPFQIPEPSKWFFPFNNNDIVSVWTLSFIRQLLQILVIDGWDSPWKTPFFLGVTLADSISIIHVGYCGKPCLKPTMTMVGIPLKMMTWGWFMAARVSHIKHHYTSYASRSLPPRLDLDFGPALAWTNPVTKVIFSC